METILYNQTTIFLGFDFYKLREHLTEFNPSKTVLLIDEQVFQWHKSFFEPFKYILIPSGESSKSLAQVEHIIQKLLNFGLDRKSMVIGVGGGVVCDLTGFIAAIFMRGIRFAFVPTTLLAQVDASIGGKNGVNFGNFKNMIGTIVQPEFIWIDVNFLNTLPKREFISGMAEVIKHACIADSGYFQYIAENKNDILNLNQDAVLQILKESIKIKTNIVSADERELGLRKLLNFGHTFGHAIEKTHPFSHGESVSLGMVIANQIAVQWNALDPIQAAKIEDLLACFGLPTNLENIQFELLEPLIVHDKKRSGQTLDLILLKNIGIAEIVSTPIEQIKRLNKQF